eukprot:3515147-Prymnesium_polylepis.1
MTGFVASAEAGGSGVLCEHPAEGREATGALIVEGAALEAALARSRQLVEAAHDAGRRRELREAAHRPAEAGPSGARLEFVGLVGHLAGFALQE